MKLLGFIGHVVAKADALNAAQDGEVLSF